MSLPYEIHEWPLDSDEGREGLRLALATRERPDCDLVQESERVVRRWRRHPRRWGRVTGVKRGAELIFAAAGVESGGRAALVFLPDGPFGDWGKPAEDCLGRLVESAGAGGVVLLEALVAPSSERGAESLRGAGFRNLTTLEYLSRWVDRSDPPTSGCGISLKWEEYTEEKRPLFIEALNSSYLESQDCPELCGLRPTADVLEGHRDAGCFDPGRWWVAVSEEAVAGVILVNPLESAPAGEVVYLGVSKEVRRRGVAHALLRRAMHQARACGDTIMTLAVDQRNGAAMNFYHRWGFEGCLRRAAWIATPGGT